jgi:hypothetical protein
MLGCFTIKLLNQKSIRRVKNLIGFVTSELETDISATAGKVRYFYPLMRCLETLYRWVDDLFNESKFRRIYLNLFESNIRPTLYQLKFKKN